jgi:hypothetical protein
MDSFESLVAGILEREGYWVRTRFKVELTKEEKRMIGRPSAPRWELDLIAYKAGTNELLVIECKSYLDSYGVRISGFDGSHPDQENYYKLFNDDKLREIVLQRLVAQLVGSGASLPNPNVRLCLAAGKIRSEKDREELRMHFDTHNWTLFDEDWLFEKLTAMSASGYEDDVATLVAKLVFRQQGRKEKQ